MTLIAENDNLLELGSSHFSYSSESEAQFAGYLDFRIPFYDGSLLIATANLRSNEEIEEFDYYYCYRDADNIRVFSYDDREHHPNVATFPHHMHKGPKPNNGVDQPWPCDLDPLNFFAVFNKVIGQFR